MTVKLFWQKNRIQEESRCLPGNPDYAYHDSKEQLGKVKLMRLMVTNLITRKSLQTKERQIQELLSTIHMCIFCVGNR